MNEGINTHRNTQSDKTAGPVISAKRAALIGLLTFAVLAVLVTGFIYQRYNNLRVQQKDEALALVNNVRARLQESLAYSLSATKTLSFFIQKDGSVKNFDSIAPQILEASNDIDAVQLVPDGIIQYVYPLKGNEKVLGYNILQDPARNKEAFKAIEKKELFFAGPLQLRQGGIGVVGRLPIFRNEKFWGFTAVIIKMPTLLRAAGIESTIKSGYYFQLSKINPDTKKEEFFIANAQHISDKYSVSVNVPNGEWKLSATPIHTYRGFGDIILMTVLGLLFSILGGMLAFFEAGRPKKLNDLVNERTLQLKESEENYKILFEKSPLPLWIYDLETYKVLEVNDAAINLYGYSREEFIDMSLLAIRREEDIEKFLADNNNVSGELREAGVWTHIKKNKEEIQVLIFSRNINYKGIHGRLVLLMDVSEKIKIEHELIKSEEKYRSLIEQASDAIILYSFDGTIHSFNRAACMQTGYTREEFEKLNLKELFFETVVQQGSTNHTNDSTTLYRKLKKKDGSLFTVELNTRMLPDGKIIAIVRDITEREKAAEAIKLSEEKYRTLVDQASDGIFISDKTGHFLIVNPSGYQLSQYNEEELKKLTIVDLVPVEDLEKNPFRFEEMSKGKVARAERRLKRKDGTFMEVEVTAKFISGDRFLAFVRDITERKQNDYTLLYQARLLDAVSDAITSLDTERRIVSWNFACEELYGFKTEEVIGKRIPELVAFEYPYTNNEEVFKQVFTTGQWRGEFNFIHPKNRNRYHLLSSINLLKNKEGQNIGFIITSNDISERIKAEEEMKKSNERFELIAQATNEVVWDYDFIKNETWGNKKLYELYGFENSNKKINLEMFLQHIHPDEREGVARRMQFAIENSVAAVTEEFRFKTAAGGYRNFYDRGYIKYDSDGIPIRILGAMQDITERETIKKQIIKEKELSDSIINSLPGIFYLYNKEGKFLRWNKNLETVTGYTSEEISKLHPLDLFDTEDQALLSEKIANVFVTGEDNVEADFLLKNKQKVPYYFTGQAIEYEGTLCLMGVGLDFSDKEKAKRAILQSEAKYKELIEQASDGIFISNKAGKYIDVNSSACRMLGYTKEELLGMSGADILYHPVDITTLQKSYDTLNAGTSYIRETTLKKKDGTPLDVESNSKMLSDGRFIGIVRDLTERKKADKAIRESEERYRALVDNATEALVVFDAEKKKFVNVSESALKMFKMTRPELLQLGPVEVSPEYQPDGRLSSEAAMEKVGEALEGNKPSFEWTHQDKEGNLIPCEVWLVRLPSETELLVRGTLIDISERKKAAEEIKTNSELLRELYSYLQNIREEERTHIAREIHDELGQQLTGLKMDLFWINRRLKTDDKEISEKLTTTLNLIDTTITTVRKIATELRPSILDDLGLFAALEWQGEEFEKRSDIKVNFHSSLNETFVLPDTSTALFRIYQELLTNVARHSGAGLVNTSIYIDKEKLYLKVEDNGAGFDIENIISKKTLGLRGIKERTSLIGGTYEIKTIPGSGTSVLISVPLHNTVSNSN